MQTTKDNDNASATAGDSRERYTVKTVRKFRAPGGYCPKSLIVVTAQSEWLGGNRHPHFSVTCAIGTERQLASGDWQAGGCLHDEAAQVWPAIKPIIALHLADSDTGEPMHAVSNGFYHLAGAVDGNFGAQYHAGNSERHFPITPDPETPWNTTEYRFPTHAEALQITADYLRLTIAEVETLRDECAKAFAEGCASVATSEEVSPQAETARTKAGNLRALARFQELLEAYLPRWKAEAEAGLTLIRELAIA